MATVLKKTSFSSIAFRNAQSLAHVIDVKVT